MSYDRSKTLELGMRCDRAQALCRWHDDLPLTHNRLGTDVDRRRRSREELLVPKLKKMLMQVLPVA